MHFQKKYLTCLREEWQDYIWHILCASLLAVPGVEFGVAIGAFWDSFWRVHLVNLQDAPVSFQDLIIESIRDWTGGEVILLLGVGLRLFSCKLIRYRFVLFVTV